MKEIFAENPVYLSLAIVGTVLFVLKMSMFLISGDGDGDIDGDHDMDGGDNFSFVSIQSILAFMMGAGWLGLAAKREWGYQDQVALLIAIGFGVIMMGLSAFLSFKIKQLNSVKNHNVSDTVGSVGQVYANIPAKGEGRGQVEIVFSGRKQIFPAMSVGSAIASFQQVKVVEIDSAENLIVKKV